MISDGGRSNPNNEPKVNRRDFLLQSTALGVSVAAVAYLPNQAVAAPKKGGRFTIAMPGASTNNTLDPAAFIDEYEYGLGYALRNNLTEIDSTKKLIGELAESWETSPDAKKWTFRLRKGVEFHNGKSLDSTDVVASINHHRGADSKSAAKPIVEPIEDIKADGKDIVIVTLKEGSADFAFLLSDVHLNILPAKEGAVDWQSGTGTGGYILRTFKPGVTSELKRNPNYWKPDKAHFDEVEIIAVNDVVARTSALVSGEASAIPRCDLKTVDQLAKSADVRVEENAGFEHFTAPMLTDVAPFDNNDVRLAFKHAVDREAMLDKILNGHGSIGNDHPISPAHRYVASDIPQHHYDPDKAKFYLKKAGLSGLKVDLSTAEAAFGGATDAAVLIKESAAKCGIDVNIVREADDAYWSNVWLVKPWCMGRWGGRPTEDWMFSVAYAADAPWNDTHWKNEQFNKLLVAARAELDEGKRARMYREMQQLVHDEGGEIVLLFANWVDAMSNKVQHAESVSPVFMLDGLKAPERWWFA